MLTQFLLGYIAGSLSLIGLQILAVELRRYRRIKRTRRMGFVDHGRTRVGR